MNTSLGDFVKAGRNPSGFTLIELMIVVSIVAILSAVAYPSYVKYVQKSRRADALSALAQTQVMMERCYAQTFVYDQACSGLTFPFDSNQRFYSITQPAKSPTTFTLTAKAQGSQAADTLCATISINEVNVRTAFDTSGTPQAECWNP